MKIVSILLIYVAATVLTAKAQHASPFVVEQAALNILYLGIDNPISVAADKYRTNELLLSAENAKLKQWGNGEYYISPLKQEAVKLRCRVITDAGDTVDLGSKVFRTRMIPDPIVLVAGKQGGLIKRNILFAQSGIQTVLKDFPYEVRFWLLSFAIKVSGSDRVYRANSPRFTHKMKAATKEVRKSEAVRIFDIKVKGPDGIIRILEPVEFVLW